MKKIIAVIVIFSIGIFINSCGSKDTVAPNVIKFWHFWSEPNQKQALIELIQKFEQEYSCKVELTELSWNDGKTKLIAAFNSGVAPDVLELGSDWITQFSSVGVLSAISPDSIDFAKFLEFSIPPAVWDNNHYAVPWIVDTRLLFYNRKLMEDAGITPIPPTTYTDLIDFANRINHSSKGIYGFGTNGSDPHRLYKKILPIIWTFGGEILDSLGNPVINSSKNTEALNIYLQLSRTGMIETQRQLDSYFAQGKIGFVFSGAWLIEKIKNENPHLDFGVALMPTNNGIHSSHSNNNNNNSKNNKNNNPNAKNNENVGISFLGCQFLSLNAKSEKKELGLQLIRFLTDGANSIELAKQFSEGGFPADRAYFNSEVFLNDKLKTVFARQLSYAKTTPVHPRWLDIEAIIENAVAQAVYGEKNANDALNDAQVAVLKLLNEK